MTGTVARSPQKEVGSACNVCLSYYTFVNLCNELLWSAMIHPLDHCLPIDDFFITPFSLLTEDKLTNSCYIEDTLILIFLSSLVHV